MFDVVIVGGGPAGMAAALGLVRGLGLSLGVAVFGTLLTRELQGRAPSPAATAAAIPDVLFWGAPAAAVLMALLTLLPREAH
ncbi:FAD-dependent oxidoreductase [Spongiactinospora rosea]|nr:FAD-dependent oxidoreductase [Spongiactinospora rosea]